MAENSDVRAQEVVVTSVLATDDLADAILIDQARSGERDAYALLYERHAAIAGRVARSLLSNPSEVDDVVSEVFASVLSALERGNGPVGTFLPYLLSSVRNECYRVNRRTRREPANGTIEEKASDADRCARTMIRRRRSPRPRSCARRSSHCRRAFGRCCG